MFVGVKQVIASIEMKRNIEEENSHNLENTNREVL
jgi:hypothetical protein